MRMIDKEKDLPQILDWGKRWGAEIDPDLLPETGFIVPGVCAYFVYLTNSRSCWLENLIRNPDISSEEAEKSIKDVTFACLAYAKSEGFKVANAATNIPKVLEKSKYFKCEQNPGMTVLRLKL